MRTLTAKQVAEGYLDAFAAHDHERSKDYLDPKLSFVGPIDTFDNADDFVESAKKLDAICQRIDKRHVIAEGNDVCILYDMVTGTPIGTSNIAQYFHVEGGRITAIETYFDARPFAAMFGQ